MFAKYALAARLAPRGKAPVGGARIVVAADRPGCVTAVWQRNPISGRLELRWQTGARPTPRLALVAGRDERASADFVQPDRQVA